MKRSAKRAVAPAPPDKLHRIDLHKGKFDGTTLQDLRDAFAEIERENHPDLCVFFHGGLVTPKAGMESAGKLMPGYQAAESYPFFFIWHSGLLDAIEGILHPHAESRAFLLAANRAVSLTASKIAAALDQDRTLRVAIGRSDSKKVRSFKELAEFAEKFDRAWANAPPVQLGSSLSELDQFTQYLLSLERRVPTRRREFRAKSLVGSLNPFGRIIHRFNTGHDHGLYTTVIEELLIAAGVRKFASRIWREMKNFIDESFTASADAGGTAFIEELCQLMQRKPELRVTLIGHSAGSIYIQCFLEALDRRLPQNSTAHVEVVFAAAAVTFERVYQGLSSWGRRVSQLRFFGLSDQREGGYPEVPPIYDKSLLYIVSSLCEYDPNTDKPIVGMQRYWSGKRPYRDGEILALTDVVGARRVWAPSKANAPPGWRSNAMCHGGFPEEDQTNRSFCYILEHGFSVKVAPKGG